VHLVTPSAHRTHFMKSARWTAPPSSPYAADVEAYRAVMEKNQQRPLPDAARVGLLVADVVERRGFPFRLDVGANVRVLRAMVRWLPAWLRLGIVSAIFSRATASRSADLSVARTRT
jgi:hypothetical protein